MADNVQTGSYNATSLERALLAFQEHYGMSSVAFMSAYRSDGPELDPIPGFQRHTWASFYREWQELTGEDEPREDPLALQIERELEPA